ncbi:hypothetical protein PIB30_077344 [Stylosanthes scabra]|uniref:Replication factor A C-terminal domain-containing protein n=1 Tax=Stylosanthes scabra TaxID=79078 RepID=A0ABU6RR22_9FABA|nr:hypothetical protein [Stylosanthes scabra]
MGTIKEVKTEYGWWYRSCKDRLCTKSLKDIGGKYKCDGCGAESTEFTPRYKIHLTVVNETESISFIVFEREAQNFLKKSYNELRRDIFENVNI